MGGAILYITKKFQQYCGLTILLFLFSHFTCENSPQKQEFQRQGNIDIIMEIPSLKRFVPLKCQRLCLQIYPKSRTKQKSLTNGKTGVSAELFTPPLGQELQWKYHSYLLVSLENLF